MRRVSGRHLYVVSIAGMHAPEFAEQCQKAQITAVWVRLGRGENRDANLEETRLRLLQTALSGRGVELWGWHVPFCATRDAAAREADLVVECAENANLAGIVIDAERTPESPRFQGSRVEAEIYSHRLRLKLEANGLGLALSSHDQPSLHRDLPFQPFLDHVLDICPQVYYRDHDAKSRLGRSLEQYRELGGADMLDRYKPTGNITTKGDVRLSSEAACYAAADTFLTAVADQGITACGFWCLDEAPEGIFDVLARN